MYFSKIVSLTLLLMITTTAWSMLIPPSTIEHENSQNNFQPHPKSFIQPRMKSMETLDLKAPPPIQRNAHNQEFDEWRVFWVVNIETMEDYQINATLRAVGPHCLIYSDLSTSLNPTFLVMNDSFETVIYPTLYKFYGYPPDIDDNDRVIILVFDIIDPYAGGQFVAGFFYSVNQFPKTQFEHSNEAEIIFIDGNEGKKDLEAGDFATLAHEFQHMIHFGYDSDEDIWLDEGASMFAEYLVDEDPFIWDYPYPINTYKYAFYSNPDVSLTYWDYDDVKDLVMANYGASYAFFLYLAEHYGGSSTIQNLVDQSKNGIESVELVLRDLGYSVEFREVFRNWTIANFLDDTSFAHGTYGYYNTSLSMNVEYSYFASTLPRTENSVPYWGTDYIRFTSRMGQPFILEFQGDPTSNFMVTAILTNDTTTPKNTVVIPVDISPDNFGNFSIEKQGVSADEIVLTISAYTPIGKNDYSDEGPAPAQDYWFMINPMGIDISPGELSFSLNGLSLRLSNIKLSDQNGYYWQEADGATYTILTDSGDLTGISGNLTFNSEVNSWMSDLIDVSTLAEENHSYQVKYYFFNSTHSGCVFSKLFLVEESSSSQSSSETTNGSIIPGFMLVIAILSISVLISNRRKK